MALTELCPNNFLDGSLLGIKLLRDKGINPPNIFDSPNLPISREAEVSVMGRGDWMRRSSSEGSVAYGLLGVVIKAHVGEPLRKDTKLWIEENARAIEAYKQVSVPTMLVLVDPDGLGPSPMVVQQTIEGTKLCKTPWNKILNRHTLEGIKKIVDISRSELSRTGMADIGGQRLILKSLSRIVYLFPFFTDNILITPVGDAILCDNVPSVVENKLNKLIAQIGLKICSLELDTMLGGIKLLKKFRDVVPWGQKTTGVTVFGR